MARGKAASPEVGIPDTQAKKVYKWQWQFAEFESNYFLSKKEIRKWLDWACKKLKLSPPKRLKIRLLGKKGKHSYFNVDQHELAFLPCHRNVPTVLHEISHYLCHRIYGKTVADHGPEFMGIFLLLLELSGRWPTGLMYAAARKYGLDIDGAQPKRLKRRAAA